MTDRSKVYSYRNRYNTQNYDSLRVVVPKGRKATVEALAEARGQSVNSLVNGLLRDAAGMDEEQWRRKEGDQDV